MFKSMEPGTGLVMIICMTELLFCWRRSRLTPYSRMDPDGKILRLDAHAVIKDKSGNGVLYINYKGKINVTEGLGKILARADDMKTTEWGGACE